MSDTLSKEAPLNCNVKRQKPSEETYNDMTNGIHEKSKLGRGPVDESYFLSYSDVELHRTMIEDQVRTTTYQQAIFQNTECIKDKVVIDVGCGTGILSMFCAQVGARKVYAIEASEIVKQARELVKANGFQDIITVIEGKVEEVELPEKADVLISEWMGYMMLYEAMLPSVLITRDKWLKPGGKIFPERAALYMALSEAQWITKYEENAYDFWISLQHTYNLDMCLLADQAVSRYKDAVHIHMISQDDLASFPTTVCDLNLYTVTEEDLHNINHVFSLKSMGSRLLNSFVLWFDVWFPGGFMLSTSPDNEDTHWQNTVFPIPLAKLKQDTEVKGNVKITQSLANYRFLNIQFQYTVDCGQEVVKSFKMDDTCSDIGI